MVRRGQLMGLNLSNGQIAKELNLKRGDVQQMVTQLCEGVVKKTDVILQGTVEFDEVYVVAGHRGNPEAVAEECSWTWNIRKRETANFRNDSTKWRCCDSDASQCTSENH